MTVAVHVNITRENASQVALDVCRELNRLNVRILMPDELKGIFKLDYVEFIDEKETVKECDILISIGGDGTIIHSAHDACEFDKPILGINAGRLGFLAGLEKQELHLLEKLITADYTVDKRMMLDVRHYESGTLINEYSCLNDIVIARGISFRLCEIVAENNGKLIFDYLADGLIVATPTGSTAYSLSAGGPVVDTDIESIILTPVCNHSLFSRSMVFKSESEIRLTVKNPENSNPVFSCDGQDGIPMTSESEIIVTRSQRYTKIIRIKSDSFTDILSYKLIERYGHV